MKLKKDAMNYNQLTTEAYKQAKMQGLWDCVYSHEHYTTMVITEICEAIEADRRKSFADDTQFSRDIRKGGNFNDAYSIHMRGTVNEELADAAIRLFSLSGYLEIDFTRFSPCNYYRVFSRFSFTENAHAFIKGLCRDSIVIERRILWAVEFLKQWAEQLNIDLFFHIEAKIEYNKTRQLLSEKAY